MDTVQLLQCCSAAAHLAVLVHAALGPAADQLLAADAAAQLRHEGAVGVHAALGVVTHVLLRQSQLILQLPGKALTNNLGLLVESASKHLCYPNQPSIMIFAVKYPNFISTLQQKALLWAL